VLVGHSASWHRSLRRTLLLQNCLQLDFYFFFTPSSFSCAKILTGSAESKVCACISFRLANGFAIKKRYRFSTFAA
jgi:hypothetical protein